MSALLLTAWGGVKAQTAYEFNAEGWVSIDANRTADTYITYNSEENTITVVSQVGTTNYLNNVALANGSSETGELSTSSMTISSDQHWFVVIGTNLSTADDASKLWWMNGQGGFNVDPSETATLDDGRVVLAWDLRKNGLDTPMTPTESSDYITLSGWTGFGLTSSDETTHTSVISEIGFYTEDGLNELISSEPYTFVATDWAATNDHASVTTVAYGDDDNTIIVSASGDLNVALSNSPTAKDGDETIGITTGKYYITQDQTYFVVIGTNLSTTAGDLWWMNGNNLGGVVPTATELSDGKIMFVWDLSNSLSLPDEKNHFDGWTCFALTSTTGTSTIYDINFYSADEVEEISSGYVHVCTANLDHWTLAQTGGTNGALQLDEWATQSDEIMSVPFLEYYVWEGENGTTYLSDATITHEQLTDLTPGVYEVSMDIRIIDYAKDAEGGNATLTAGTKFIANGVSEDLLTGSDGTEDDYDNSYDEVYGTYTLTCVVDQSGTLDISLDIKDATYSWIMFKNLKVQLLETPTITWEMTSAGWGTLVLPFASSVPSELTAYTCAGLESDNKTLSLTEAETLAANTPYILAGTAGTYTFTGTYEEATTLTTGLLTGTFVDMDYTALSAVSGTVYLLQKHTEEDSDYQEGEGLGVAFYPVTEDSAPNETTGSEGASLTAYHCYLTSTVSLTSLRLPGMETGIVAVEGDLIASDAIYDLSGRRVSKAVKGVYIMNGKKVLVK